MTTYTVGQNIWVPHKDVGFTLGTIVEVASGNKLSVRLDEFDTVQEINTETEEVETVVIDKETLLGTEDLTKLPDLHRPSLLEALRQRFLKDKIYTYTGHILIGINPFKDLDVYNRTLMKNYAQTEDKTLLPPHVFFIANDAYKNMISNEGRNQSVLVSGESGAGKTVTTKIVLDYLTFITDQNATDQSPICQKVLQSNPVLEAFGNAKTLRNDNSSRFGKLILLEFQERNFKSELNGCKIDTYLLEKARVMNHSKGERNFHIFYELHEGLSEKEKDELKMPHVEDSLLTNAHGRRVYRSDIEDAEQWQKTLRAMKTVGISEEEIEILKKIVVAVMHLGEVSFKELENNTDGAVEIRSHCLGNAKTAAELLEIPFEEMEAAFCSRTITLGNKKQVAKKNNVDQALEARNAIAMALYERMFLWLVWKTNKGMSNGGKATPQKMVGKYMHTNTISVLDIFGFEVFVSNTFEQLFINYANEVLQQLFNEFVFKVEQAVYEQERIDWTQIEFPDNTLCIDLVENRKQGVLKILDDECLLPKGSDSAFHDKLKRIVAKNNKALSIDDNRQTMQKLFTISHFAGDVEYKSESFCVKNKNELRVEQIQCIRSSSNNFIKYLIPEDPALASGAASAGYFDEVETEKQRLARGGKSRPDQSQVSSTQRLQQSTVGANFRNELHVAIEKIKASELHFVRCIKPNDQNLANDFDRKRVLEQLNYSGVLEAVRISRLGYSSRFLFKEFVGRFFILLPGKQRRLKSNQNADFRNQCLDILETSSLKKPSDYQVGTTKIFLKSDAFTELENLKRSRQAKSILVIQKNMRSFLLRNRIFKLIQERKKKQEEERQRKLMEEKKKALDQSAKQTEIKKVESRQYLPMRLVSDQDVLMNPKLDYLKLHGEPPGNFEDEDLMKLGKGKSKKGNRVSKSKGRSKSKSKQRKSSVKEESDFMAYLNQFIERLKKLDADEIYVDDAPLLLGSSFCFTMLLFNLSGFHLQAIFNFLLIFGGISGMLMFIVQKKVESDNRKLDVYKYEKNRPKSKKFKQNQFFDLYSDDEVMMEPIRRKRGSMRSLKTMRTHNSKDSKKKTMRTKQSTKKDYESMTMTTADRVLSQKGTVPLKDGAPKRKFTGMNVKSKRGTSISSSSKPKENDLKKSKSRYTGVSYNFPEKG